MRILMFGRGVIATIYGHALQAAGHEVEFYVRPGRAAEYGEGVHLDVTDGRRSPLGRRFQGAVPLRLRESVEPADGFELVVVSVAHDRLSEAAAFLAPRIGGATVLVFGNVWDEPLAAVAPLPDSQVLFGFPQAGGGVGKDGVLHGALMRDVLLGEAAASAHIRGSAVEAAFRQAGFRVRVLGDIRDWLWLHFIADVGMHAQGSVHGGLSNLIGDRRALREALLIGRELLPVLSARGADLRQNRNAQLPLRLPGLSSAAMAWATSHVAIAQISLAAHTDPDAPEARAVLRDALREARRLGVPTPRLDAALAGSIEAAAS
jgi:Ketopantoate reductase